MTGDDALPTGPPWAPGYRHRTEGEGPIAFRSRVQPEDFRVDELPAFEPTGSGDHCLFEIEKRGLGTLEAIGHLARALDRRREDFGYAGRKDARAVTRQWLSLEHVEPSTVLDLPLPGVRVLRAWRHDRKLRLGQLAGNAFTLLLRELPASDVQRVRRVLDVLERAGLPNYFGSQRFGAGGRGFELGRALLTGDAAAFVNGLVQQDTISSPVALERLSAALAGGTRGDQRRLVEVAPGLAPELAAVAKQLARRPFDLGWAVRAVPAHAKDFHLSALQSRIFNRTLAARLAAGRLFERGDRVVEHEPLEPRATTEPRRGGGTPIPLELGDADFDALRARADALELAATGALPGHQVRPLEGPPAEFEARALADEGLTPADFERAPKRLRPRGARRPLIVPLRRLACRTVEGGLELRFALPKGSFATSVLEELAKEHAAPR